MSASPPADGVSALHTNLPELKRMVIIRDWLLCGQVGAGVVVGFLN